MEKKKKTSGTVIFRHIICIIMVLLALFPFYVLIINSTLESNVIKQGIHLLPGSHFFENYKNLMIKTNATSTVNLWQAMRNSLIVTVPTTLLQVYFASLTAYGLTVYQFKGRDFAAFGSGGRRRYPNQGLVVTVYYCIYPVLDVVWQ